MANPSDIDLTKFAPVQVHPVSRDVRGRVPRAVHLAAYEVYRVVHGEQIALRDGDCRGGFGTGELAAFLYARAFPREEWRARVDEAFDGMRLS